MGPGLFHEWLEFYELEPWGHSVMDSHLSYALAVLVNAVTGGRRVSRDRSEPYQPDAFLIRHGTRRKRQPEREMSPEETMRYVATQMGLGAPPPDMVTEGPQG